MDPRSGDEEFTAARSLIGTAAEAPVHTAACPFGAYDRTVLAALRSRLQQVFTSDRRRARAGGWLQPRYSVAGRHRQTVRDDILAAAA